MSSLPQGMPVGEDPPPGRRDVRVGTSVGTVTEPDCLGRASRAPRSPWRASCGMRPTAVSERGRIRLFKRSIGPKQKSKWSRLKFNLAQSLYFTPWNKKQDGTPILIYARLLKEH